MKPDFALGMEVASPDLEKQGFLAVVFVNREYSEPGRRKRPDYSFNP